MDPDAALQALQGFIELLKNHQALWSNASVGPQRSADKAPRDMFQEQIRLSLHLIDRIVEEVDPRYGALFRTPVPSGYSWEHKNRFDAAQQAAGALGTASLEEAIFGIRGPKLAAANMHRWVWDHAASYWDDGYRRAAIQEAATAIYDHYLPSKLKRNQDTNGGADLIGQAFSDKSPEPGIARLRLPGYDRVTREKDWTSAHAGAMRLGQGAAFYIRNLVTHNTDEPSEQEGLEMLATLSLVARLIDQAEIEQAI